MESFTINICPKKEGIVWQNRTRISGIAPLLSITSEPADPLSSKCHHCSRIVHAIVDSTGDRVLIGDRNGFAYVFDLRENKFWLLCMLGNCCSALAFTPLEERDILIGTSDCKLHLFQSTSRDPIACLTGHDTCISRISVDSEGRRALTCSLTAALLWDLLTLTALQQLAVQKGATIVDAFFIASDEAIVTALNGDVIGMWDAMTFDHVLSYKMLGSAGDLAVRTVDVSVDGKFIAAAGRTNWVILWEVLAPDKPQVLTVARNISTIRQIAFLYVRKVIDCNHILLVLNHTGVLHLYSVETGENVFDINLDNERILNIYSAGKSGKFVVCTCSGRALLYDFGQIYLAKERRHPLKSVCQPQVHKSPIPNTEPQEDNNRLSDLTLERLKGIVKEFGAFPEKYRYSIWRNLLSLPNNEDAYRTLASKGIHHSYKDIATKYPIGNKTLLRALQRVLSMLAHWCPKLSEVDYLAMLAFPFVKLFHTNLQRCLETVIVFINTWCQNWFCYFPNVPYNILAAVENILSANDAPLLLHFVRHGVTAQTYAWQILQSAFSEVLSKEDWFRVFDHVFSNEPAFLLYVVAAFNVVSRGDLKRCKTSSDFDAIYRHHRDALSVREVIKTAYRLQSNSDKALSDAVSCACGTFVGIPSGSTSYPAFDDFPKLAIDLRDENRQLQEEIGYFRKRQEILLNDTAAVTKNPCTCDGKRNDIPHLSQVRRENSPTIDKKKSTKPENLFVKNASPLTDSNRPSTSGCSSHWQNVDAPITVLLQGKAIINRHHSDVIGDVLRTRKMVARDSTVKHRSVADEWNYEML